MAERGLCKPEVRGSNPLTSTSFVAAATHGSENFRAASNRKEVRGVQVCRKRTGQVDPELSVQSASG